MKPLSDGERAPVLAHDRFVADRAAFDGLDLRQRFERIHTTNLWGAATSVSGLGSEADPLAQFFHSLDRMHELAGVTVVLPAHGHPFTGLDERVEAIKEHHEQRLETLRKASDLFTG